MGNSSTKNMENCDIDKRPLSQQLKALSSQFSEVKGQKIDENPYSGVIKEQVE